VKLYVPVLMSLAAVSATSAFAQVTPNEPTKEEIAEAYRTKSLGVGMAIPALQWERWRIKEIRGWKLHFKRIGEKRSPGVITHKYEAVARKNGWCADYEIADRLLINSGGNPNPRLVKQSWEILI